MRATQTRPHRLFKVKDKNNGSKLVTYAQSLLAYPAMRRGEQAPAEPVHQSEQYDTQYHVVEPIRGTRKMEDRHEVLPRLVVFEKNNNEIWEPFNEESADTLSMIKNFLYSAGDCNIKQEILDLYY